MRTEPENDPWVRREPGFLELRIELMRMYRRARRRPILTIFLALLVAAGAIGMRARKKQSVAASVTFRVSEMEVEAGARVTTPRPTKELKEYIEGVAFRASRLVEIMKKRDIYSSFIDEDPVTAVEWFRSDIEVEVYRNYFLEDSSRGRSARLVVTYHAESAEEAARIATDLADLVADEEARRRVSTAQAAASDSREVVEQARIDVKLREAEIVRLEQELAAARGERAQVVKVKLAGLVRSIEPARDRLEKAQAILGDLELGLVLEMNSMGVRFDKIDESIEVVTRGATPDLLGLLGAVVFVFALPFAIMSVGAFDSRVYDLDDVNRLGLRGVGHIPPFRGSDVGSLEARARASGRV
jgi:hypothetical protein